MKVCIACSAGGHLTEALELEGLFRKYNYLIITSKESRTIDLKKRYKINYLTDPGRNILKYFKLFFESFLILLKERPDFIISTGAGITVPFCIIGKTIFNSKLIFIESIARIFRPSLTGRILYFFSDLFIVQWDYLLKFYGKKAIYGGQLI